MLFDNPIFADWYTDTVDVYRTEEKKDGSITRQVRVKVNDSPIPCRMYSPKNSGPSMTDTAAKILESEQLACDLDADIRAGDELMIIRGGNLGHAKQPVRYFAGDPVPYYDPVGGILTGLEHQEIGLLKENLIRR